MGQGLIANLAAVALFVSAWNHAQLWLETSTKAVRHACLAAFMGGGAVVSMMLAIRLDPGIIFDLRSALIAVAGFFGGPFAAVIAGGMAALYRAWLGGQGAAAGLIGIGVAAGIGATGHALLRGRNPGLIHVLLLAAAVSIGGVLTISILPAPVRAVALNDFAPAIGLLTFAATTVAALAVLHMLGLSAERRLLRAALAQAPDFQFIKNTRSEFVAVNQAVAAHNGFRRAADMRGGTDFDIAPTVRALELFADEQRIFASGEPLVDKEEKIRTVNGATQWFSTSKSVLRDGDGNIIGLAGVTRDITKQKNLEAELMLSRHQLIDALADISDGIALLDAQGCLSYYNRQFQECFPLSGDAYAAGLHAVEFLRAVGGAAAHGPVSGNSPVRQPEEQADILLSGGELEWEFRDLRRVRLRSRRGREGTVVVLASDITRQRETERMLDAFAVSLKAMTETGAAQGPFARQAFDREIRAAMAQAAALKRSVGAAC